MHYGRYPAPNWVVSEHQSLKVGVSTSLSSIIFLFVEAK